MTGIFWYKFYAMHGGGHQGQATNYRFFERKLDSDEQDDALEEWCKQFRNVKATIEEVDKPPKEAVLNLLSDAQLALACAEHSAKILTEQLWLINNP